jgi:hypothetical protein
MCSKKSKKWQGMLQQGIYLLLERRHALCRHSVAQEIQLLGPEFALFAVDDQAKLAEQEQEQELEMLHM